MVAIPTSMPTEDVRPFADHRRHRNVTRLIGTHRRTSITPINQTGPTVQEMSESSMARVKKKIKHKRMWDEPESQASEIQNTTSKRPDRIKTRRRLIPSSSTARTLRTAAVIQEDPYYDFGKKIKHTSSSTVGINVLDLETKTSVKSPLIIVPTTEEDKSEVIDVAQVDKLITEVKYQNTPRSRTQLTNRNHNTSIPNNFRRAPENLTECVYPRFSRRNKQRAQRDARCFPESDATRSTRILSTVVTSVSSVKGNQNKNDTLESTSASESLDLTSATSSNATDEYSSVTSSITVTPEVVSSTINSEPVSVQSSGYTKHLRNRYRNISLPEYLEITKVNQRRLNVSTTVVATTEAIRSPTISIEATGSTTTNASLNPIDSYTETTLDVATATSDKPLTDSPTPPPTDLQDFIYLHNGTSEAPLDTNTVTTSSNAAVEARQRRPQLTRNITKIVSSTEHDVGMVYPEGLATSTYFLTFLAIVPLVLVIVFAFKMAIQRKKKKVFDSSEYSSEYNRSPLDFNTITSSPITTKLPRVPQHIVWDAEKLPSVPLPTMPTNNGRWEFRREKLRLQTILGQGNFGQVWKAEADDINGHEGLTRLVAVKMVKEDAASREREDLIRELSIMQHLGSHPNVVTLLGCCTEKGISTDYFFISFIPAGYI